VVKFPSRINTDIFRQLDNNGLRAKLCITESVNVIITVGRLASLKGWKFMIDSFVIYNNQIPESLLYFIGEGEDETKIKEYIEEKDLSKKVLLTGKKDATEIAEYLNAADLFIMGSFKEGWSTSLIEAIACGIPACVTNFSSAKEIIIEGSNGYVIDEHNPVLFAKGMIKASEINRPIFNENVKAFSANRLKEDILNHWNLV